MEMQCEMGVSHVVFFRSLAQLPEGSIEIILGEECERRLGLIRLPYTPVTFRYTGLSDEEREKFQARFNLTFQRGGG